MDREILSELLMYDRTSPSGLRWKVGVSNVKPMSVAGWLNKGRGGFYISIQNRKLQAHRVVWMLVHGEIPCDMEIDHIDGDRTNNVVENLRLATRSQNEMNVGVRSDNKSGCKGLYWDRLSRIWRGEVRVNGVRQSKKSKSREIVEAWLIKTRESLHGEFVRHQ